MREVRVAARLPLGPIARVVGLHHAAGASQPDQHAAVDEEVFEELRTRIAAVNQQAMHAERMAEAQGDRAEH